MEEIKPNKTSFTFFVFFLVVFDQSRISEFDFGSPLWKS